MIFDFANKAVGDKTGLVEQWHGINYQNPESAPSQDQPNLNNDKNFGEDQQQKKLTTQSPK